MPQGVGQFLHIRTKWYRTALKTNVWTNCTTVAHATVVEMHHYMQHVAYCKKNTRAYYIRQSEFARYMYRPTFYGYLFDMCSCYSFTSYYNQYSNEDLNKRHDCRAAIVGILVRDAERKNHMPIIVNHKNVCALRSIKFTGVDVWIER